MIKYAKILEVEENKILIGLLNDKGLCGTGTCEGCSCSTKLQTMRVKVDDTKDFAPGMDVEMTIPQNILSDWMILIVLPVVLVIASIILPGLLGFKTNENITNLSAIAAGLGGFITGAFILKVLRKNQLIHVEKMTDSY